MPQKKKDAFSPSQPPLMPQIGHATVIRANERRQRFIPNNPVKYFEVTPTGTRSMAMYSVTAAPGQNTGAKTIYHGGDETFLVVSGIFEIELEDRKEILGPGDSIFIPRGVGHRVTNISIENGECIFVLSPPEYSPRHH